LTVGSESERESESEGESGSEERRNVGGLGVKLEEEMPWRQDAIQ
jgi:hypothetical protein